MQKMIFSAVALVAFSFAGMANEIEEKKVEETVTERDCIQEAIDAMEFAAEFEQHDESDILFIGQIVRGSCEKNKN